MHLRARRYHKNRSAFLCLSFFCVTLLREALVQGYTVFKFYPLSLRYRDPAASPLNARQYMFENHAIKLINRQLS